VAEIVDNSSRKEMLPPPPGMCEREIKPLRYMHGVVRTITQLVRDSLKYQMCVLRCSGDINLKLLVMRDFAYKMYKGFGNREEPAAGFWPGCIP
jgi:hypothetical protein